MKKTYFAPETEILTFETEGMMAATTDTINVGSEFQEGDEVLDRTKGNSLWDDEE